MSDAIEDLLTAYSPEVHDLALRLRALVLEVQPDAVEQVDTADKLIGYGRGRKMSDLVCVIVPYKNWVNLGFARGADLPNPHGRLIGSGKRARHVRIASAADIDAAVLRPLLKAAWRMLTMVGANHRPPTIEREQGCGQSSAYRTSGASSNWRGNSPSWAAQTSSCTPLAGRKQR